MTDLLFHHRIDNESDNYQERRGQQVSRRTANFLVDGKSPLCDVGTGIRVVQCLRVVGPCPAPQVDRCYVIGGDRRVVDQCQV